MKKPVIIGGIAALISAAFMSFRRKTPRQRVVDIAANELGPQFPSKYWDDVQPALSGTDAAWCGGFALWVLRKAGLTSKTWTIGKGFASALPMTSNPLPGDIAYFHKLQHHAIVESENDGVLTTIDGNQSPGESVRRRIRGTSDAAAFYSIQGMIDDA